MKFTTTLAALVSSAAVLAAPQSGPKWRRDGAHHSSPGQRVVSPHSAVDYFTNWAGAIYQKQGVNYARGTFVVPSIKLPPGGDNSTSYGSAIWVGIDGDTSLCSTGLIQAGVEMDIYDGVAYYSAWHEWYPYDSIQTIPNFPVKPGDTIRVSVWGFTPNSGMTMVENLSTNQVSKYNYNNIPNPLCFTTAEWIVEDYTYGFPTGTLAPFPNFTTVTFTDSYSNFGNIAGAEIVDIYQDQVLTNCYDDNVSKVTCTYV